MSCEVKDTSYSDGNLIGRIEQGTEGRSYRFLSFLGSGVAGCTWKAMLIKNGIDQGPVAIKTFIYQNLYKDIQYTNRYNSRNEEGLALLEISRDSKLCKFNAVCYIDSYSVETVDKSMLNPRLVMEFIDGHPLANDIEKPHYIPLATRQQDTAILGNLILGLASIHAQGIAHQDIKEDNIMWDSVQKRYRYIDWGLPCLRDVSCSGGTCKKPCGYGGTKYAAPPERRAIAEMIAPNTSFDFNVAHDLWSLGIVLLNWFVVKPGEDITLLYYAKTRNERLDDLMHASGSGVEAAKKIIPLLFTEDWQQRVQNWQQVLNITKALNK